MPLFVVRTLVARYGRRVRVEEGAGPAGGRGRRSGLRWSGLA